MIENITIIREERAEEAAHAAVPRHGSRDDLAYARVLLAGGDAGAATALLRALPHHASSRPEAVVATLAAASLDPDFLALVANADAARDARDFVQGEYLYWRALGLYPLHHGYIAQYAHCLKEQGKVVEAESAYRAALALGGPADDLHRHIAACAASRGDPPALPAQVLRVAEPIDLPPTVDEAKHMLALFLHREPTSPEETLTLLRSCPRRRDIALALVARPEFARANPDLMTMLAGTR